MLEDTLVQTLGFNRRKGGAGPSRCDSNTDFLNATVELLFL